MQDGSGLLLHGPVGDKIVNHYSFYAAFTVDEEFRIIAGASRLGHCPSRRCSQSANASCLAGAPGSSRRSMKPISPSMSPLPRVERHLCSAEAAGASTRKSANDARPLPRADRTAFSRRHCATLLNEGQVTYAKHTLDSASLINQGSEWLLLTWLGDDANEAIACLLNAKGLRAQSGKLGVEIKRGSENMDDISKLLAEIAAEPAPPLTRCWPMPRTWQVKMGRTPVPTLLRKSYASLHLNLHEAMEWLGKTFNLSSHSRAAK